MKNVHKLFSWLEVPTYFVGVRITCATTQNSEKFVGTTRVRSSVYRTTGTVKTLV